MASARPTNVMTIRPKTRATQFAAAFTFLATHFAAFFIQPVDTVPS